MAYNQSIPTANQRQKDSQPLIQGNFQAIKTLVDVNHVTFDDPSGDQGKHTFVVLQQQNSATNPDINAKFNQTTDNGFYNFLYTTSGRQEVFVRNAGLLAQQDIPMTAQKYDTPSTNGWSYLPSGILLKYGTATIAGTGQVVVDISFGPAYVVIAFVPQVYARLLTYKSGNTISQALTQTGAGTPETQLIVKGKPNEEFEFLVIGLGYTP